LIALFFIKTIEAIAQPNTLEQKEFTKLEMLEIIPEPKPVNIPPKPKTPAREAISAKSDIKEQVQSIANQYGWGNGEQWEALYWIIQKESSWRVDAQNPTSTAFGLFQFLDQTWKSYGCIKNNDVENVTQCGIKYIKARYATPIEAKAHHIRKGWY
jgi:hypothetical protein